MHKLWIHSRFLAASGVILLILWLVLLLLGDAIVNAVCARYGERLLAIGAGKFHDPAVFLKERWAEGVWLVTIAWGVCCVVKIVAAVWISRIPAGIRGIALGMIWFILINVWMAAAVQTTAFWLPFFDSKVFDGPAMYMMKRPLLGEEKPAYQIVLLGNSQTNSNIEEGLLRNMLGKNMSVAELHLPGVRGMDLYNVAQDLRGETVDLVIVYATELYVYGQDSVSMIPEFFHARDLATLQRLGGWDFVAVEQKWAAVTNDLLPTFRFRRSLASRVLGKNLTSIGQMVHDVSLEGDLEARAQRISHDMERSRTLDFEKSAFGEALQTFVAQGTRVVLIRGTQNPILQNVLPVSMRADFDSFLEQLAQRSSGKILVVQGQTLMPTQSTDFVDLTHMGSPAQARMTEALAVYLKEQSLVQESTGPK